MAIPKFFENDNYIVSEKVAVMKLTNTYDILDMNAQPIGKVQQNMSGGHKALSFIINKAMMPFHFDILDASGQAVVSIQRGWTVWMSKISVTMQGQEVARISQKFSMLKPKFIIEDTTGREIGTISGNWRAWNFVITGADGREIGKIDKKWGGAAKELFTNADKYHVQINKDVSEDTQKVAITAAAIVIDMVLKESK